MRKQRIIELVVIGALIAAAGIASAAETITYTYDAKGRVVKVQHSGSVNNNVVANYSYDRADNRTNLNVSGAP
jgi:coenzyme F420-reducing hydrogenase delta subunit